MGKTVAFPVIGLGLDAAPLKKGLKDAQGFVKGTSFVTKAWGVVDSTISKVGNLPRTLSQAALPVNQTLELAAKAQRLLGAPLRAQMALEGSNADVAAGGNRLLGSGTLSGTLARFERSFEDMMANIWMSIDQAFDVQGLLEGLRGGMAGISAIIEAAFGPIDVLGKDPKLLEAQFKAGGEFVIDTFESVAKIALSIRNGFFDILDTVEIIMGQKAPEFNKDQEAQIKEWQQTNKRMGVLNANPLMPWALGGGIKQVEMEGRRGDAIDALRGLGILPAPKKEEGFDALAEIVKDAKAGLNGAFLPGPNRVAAAAAAKSLEDFTKGLKTGGNALDQINRQYAQDIDAIDKLVNQAGNDEAAFMNANLAYKAAEDKKNMAWLETLKPLMEMDASSRFSVSFEPNSQALIESMIRAQTGTGSDNPQERMAQAVELQNQMLTEQAKIQRQQLDALNQIRNRPGAVFVGGIN